MVCEFPRKANPLYLQRFNAIVAWFKDHDNQETELAILARDLELTTAAVVDVAARYKGSFARRLIRLGPHRGGSKSLIKLSEQELES